VSIPYSLQEINEYIKEKLLIFEEKSSTAMLQHIFSRSEPGLETRGQHFKILL
jgi:hypothetical protein